MKVRSLLFYALPLKYRSQLFTTFFEDMLGKTFVGILAGALAHSDLSGSLSLHQRSL